MRAVSREEPAVVHYYDGSNVIFCQILQEHGQVDIVTMEISENDHIGLYFVYFLSIFLVAQ